MPIAETQRERENPTSTDHKPLTQKPLQKQLSAICNEFLQRTTFHGLAGLFGRRETANPLKWKNVMFLVAVLACQSFLAMNLYELGEDYLQYPVTTSILRERRDIMELPAITFCIDQEEVGFRAKSNTRF